jgi:beta-glucanase (GH16 family)
LQSREASKAGYDAAAAGNFRTVNLPFNPTTGFHEYRIDYTPGHVYFYADGVVLAGIESSAVPITPGHLVLQHWSNGNKAWSGGPPEEDAVLTVRYVKAYFNSSSEKRGRDFASRCKDAGAANAVCRIPELTATNLGAADWFFSEQHNMTNGQTVYGSSVASTLAGDLKYWWWPLVGTLVVWVSYGWQGLV